MVKVNGINPMNNKISFPKNNAMKTTREKNESDTDTSLVNKN